MIGSPHIAQSVLGISRLHRKFHHSIEWRPFWEFLDCTAHSIYNVKFLHCEIHTMYMITLTFVVSGPVITDLTTEMICSVEPLNIMLRWTVVSTCISLLK